MNEEKDLVKVYTGTEVTVYLLKNKLREIGVTCLIRNGLKSGLAAGFSGGSPASVELFLNEEDLEKSEILVSEFKKVNKE